MKITNTRFGFGLISQLVHHVAALLFIGSACLYFYSNFLPRGSLYAMSLHQSFGLGVLILLFLRLFWFACSKRPDPLGNKMDQALSILAILSLYLIMLIMPLSGIMVALAKGTDIDVLGFFILEGFNSRDPKLIYLFSQIHLWVSYLSYLIITVHIITALIHHYLAKNTSFIRMFTSRTSR